MGAPALLDEGRTLCRFLELRDAGGLDEAGARELRGLGEELARAAGRMVGYVLRRQASRIPRDLEAVVDREDLRAAGMMGFWEALLSYDPERGGRFRNYALDMIRWSMIHEVRGLDTIPRYTRSRITRALKAAEGLRAALEREPTEAEAAEAAGVGAGRYRKIREWDSFARDAGPLPEHDGAGNPASAGAEEEAHAAGLFEVGEVLISAPARKLLYYAGKRATAEIMALHASGWWGAVSPVEAWENDRAAEAGSGLLSSRYELAGGVILVVTDLDAGETTVVTEESAAWVRELPDPSVGGGAHEERRAA